MSPMKPQKMQPRNPFLVYGYANPRYFCDREAETQQMLSALENERVLFGTLLLTKFIETSKVLSILLLGKIK